MSPDRRCRQVCRDLHCQPGSEQDSFGEYLRGYRRTAPRHGSRGGVATGPGEVAPALVSGERVALAGDLPKSMP